MTLTRRSALTFAGGVVAVGVVGYLGWREIAPAPRAAGAADRPCGDRPRRQGTNARRSERWAIRRPR